MAENRHDQATGPKLEFFQGRSAAAVARMLERAAARANADAVNAKAPFNLSGSHQLAAALNLALTAHGSVPRNRPSIRVTAPDTGGRPFHFKYGNVAKHETPVRTAGQTGTPPVNDSRTSNREAAHQAYTERPAALERVAHDGPAADRDELQHNGSTASPGGLNKKAAEGFQAAESGSQRYIEDAEKVPSLEGIPASFGTIGDSSEERSRFWELVRTHERKNGRTQSRMVLELPHEATPQQRLEIVRRVTDGLTADGLPFWAAIHAPTGDNDTRNFHAHIVTTERPMRKMAHPETGEICWDFTVRVLKRKKSSGNVVSSYPYRQNKLSEARLQSYPKKLRSRMEGIVNDVMAEAGSPVRYDSRSYADMGLNVAPMKNVSRILADKRDRRSFVVMDPEPTRRRIALELHVAEARRTEDLLGLEQAEAERQRVRAESLRSQGWCSNLPEKYLSIPFTLVPGSPSTSLLKRRRSRIADRCTEEEVAAALRTVAAATSPALIDRKPLDPATAPNPAALALLHEAANDELVDYEQACKRRESIFQYAERHRPVTPGSSSLNPVVAAFLHQNRSGVGQSLWSESEARLPPSILEELECRRAVANEFERWEKTPMMVDGVAVTGLEKVWVVIRDTWEHMATDRGKRRDLPANAGLTEIHPGSQAVPSGQPLAAMKDEADRQSVSVVPARPAVPMTTEDQEDADRVAKQKSRRKALLAAKRNDMGM